MRPLSAQSQQLLTEGEVFKDEIFASTKDAAKPAEEVPSPTIRARILSDVANPADRISH